MCLIFASQFLIDCDSNAGFDVGKIICSIGAFLGRIFGRILGELGGMFSDSAINVFSPESWAALRFAFYRIFPFSGVFALTYYLYLNKISPKGFGFGDLIPFALAAINFLVVIFFFLLSGVVFGVMAGLLVVILSRLVVLIRDGDSVCEKGVYIGIFLFLLFLVAWLIFSAQSYLADFQIKELGLAGVLLGVGYLSWVVAAFFLVFSWFFFNVFHMAYRRSQESGLVGMKDLKINMVPHAFFFFAAIMGAIFFMPVGWSDALVNRVAEKSGLRVSYASLQLDSEVYDVIENNEYDVYGRMVGCKGDGYGFLNAARLIWHGFGDVSYVKLVNSVNAKTDCSAEGSRACGEALEIPSSAIKMVTRAPKIAKYCKDFVGNYFSVNSARPGNDFDELRDFVEKVPGQFNIGVIESIEIEWAADPVYSSLGNYELSKARANMVQKILHDKYCHSNESCGEKKWDEIVHIKPIGATSAQFSCKDWPNSKTKKECLEKNRGGRLVFYVKNSYY